MDRKDRRLTRDAEYYYYGTVTNVVDGDTLDVVLDLGLHVSIKLRLRLYGIDAPEMKTEQGKAAKEAVLRWLNANAVPPERDPGGPWTWEVSVKTIKDKQEKYGRFLAEIYGWHIIGSHRGSTHPQLNSWLVSNGFAKVYK